MVLRKMIIVSCLALNMFGLATSPALAQEAKKEVASQDVFIQLGQGTNDLHAALMALKIGEALVQAGSKVTLFLNLEAVRIADKRQPNTLSWGVEGAHSLGHLYDSFVKRGGKVMVCPMCAKNAGLDAKNLRDGATIAKDPNEIAQAILRSDKTLSY